jgi:membrane-bound metal-dependent hydrolase YbcI (DUF457 family)
MGVAALTAARLSCPTICLVLAMAFNTMIHPLIDALGHEEHWWQSHPRRHALTHSLLGSTMLTIILYAPLYKFLAPTNAWVVTLFLPLLLSSYSHLFLDMLNPSGIYICGRRISLRVARYSNPLANLFFQLLGVTLLVYSLLAMQ